MILFINFSHFNIFLGLINFLDIPIQLLCFSNMKIVMYLNVVWLRMATFPSVGKKIKEFMVRCKLVQKYIFKIYFHNSGDKEKKKKSSEYTEDSCLKVIHEDN